MGETIKLRIDIEGNSEKVLKSLNLNMNDFNELVGTAIKQSKKLASETSKVAQSAVIFNAFTTATEHLQDLLGGLIEDFNAFDKSMRAVNTMAGENKKGLDALTDQVEDLASVIPLAKTELANGLYQVISNGVPKDNWISFLEASANALAGTINQFGLSAEEADRVINVLAVGSKYGAAEIEDLSQSFKVVGAAASAMGLTVESTAGALEILSQANLKGSEAKCNIS